MNKLYKVFLVLFLFSLFSCEIGLGSAVDTEPPTLNIVSPVSDAVIRDAFRLSGTWSDDGSIADLQVYLEAPDGTASYGPFEGVFVESEDENVENTWYCVVDPKASGVPDGSYEAKISMTDEGEHTTTQSRLLVVDNTAPIIVLQRPSSKAGDSSPDSYGQTFTLEGQAADDNNVSLIRVNIFSDEACTQRVHYVDLTNVPPTISLDVAKFGEDNYTKIYGSSGKDGAKEFYCTIEGYDGSVRYPADGSVQTPEDLLGNPVHSYYLYEEIGTSILSQHKITEVYHMLNGSYLTADTSRSVETVNAVTSLLNSKVVSTGRFSLNPENNPTFIVSGKDQLVKDSNGAVAFTGGNYDITNGSKVVVEVSPGLDAIPLKGDSLSVYIVECDAAGNRIPEAQEIHPTTESSKSGATYKFIVPIDKADGLVIGRNYIFGVSGTDEKDNYVMKNGNGYGFHFASSGAAPGLTITEPAGSSISLGKSAAGDFSIPLRIAGTTSVEVGAPVVTITDGGNPIWSKTFAETEASEDPVTKKLVYTFDTGDAIKFSGASAYHELDIISTADGSATTRTKTVTYDCDAPVIGITVDRTYNKYDTSTDETGNTFTSNYLNGNAKFTVSISDEFSAIDINNQKPIVKVYKVSNTDELVDTIILNPTTSNVNEIVNIDTKKYSASEYKLRIDVTAYDKSGNEKTESSSVYNVDQSTNTPLIFVENASETTLSFDTSEKLSADTQKRNRIEAGQKLSLISFDDKAVDSVTVKENDVDASARLKKLGGNALEFEMNTIPLIYKLEFEIKDKEGNSNNYTFYVQSTSPRPVLTLDYKKVFDKDSNEVACGYATTGGKFENKITINSTEFIPTPKAYFEVYRGTDISNLKVPANKLTIDVNEVVQKNTYSFTDTINEFPTETTKYYYVVVDNNGNASERMEVECKVDKEPPENPTITKIPSVTETEDTTLQFKGSVADKGTGSGTPSGIKSINIKFKNTVDATESAWLPVEGETWTYYALTGSDELKTVFATEGLKKFAIKSEDNAGNINESFEQEFTYDKAAPVLNYTNKPSQLSKNQIKLNGTVIEGYGIKNNKIIVKETVDGASPLTKDITLETPSNNVYAWELDIPLTGREEISGNYKYEFTVEDEAGKISNSSFSLERDLTPPVVTLSSPNNNTYGTSSISADSTVISGTVTETNPNKLYYKLWKGSTEPANYSNIDISALSGNAMRWNVPVDSLTDGEWTFKYYAEDISGNKSTEATQSFMVDMAVPEITYSVYSVAEDDTLSLIPDSDNLLSSNVTSGKSFVIKGNVRDANGIKSFILKDSGGNDLSSNIVRNGDAWEYTPASPEEKTYTFTISAVDNSGNAASTISGKTTALERTVNFDKSKPTAAITTTMNNGWLQASGKTYISGTASDVGSGLASIEFKLDNGSYEKLTLADDWTKQIDVDALEESLISDTSKDHTITIKVTDKVGLSDEVNKTFKLDRSTPAVENFAANRSYINNKNNDTTGTAATNKVAFTGYLYDGNKTSYRSVKSAYLIATKKNNSGDYEIYNLTTNTLNSADITTYGMPLSLSSETNANFGYFSQEIELTGTNDLLSDGTYKFKVVGYDLSGRECSSTELQLIVDTTSPFVEDPILSNWGDKSTYTSGDHKSSSVTISSSIKESNPDTVYYYLYDGSDSSKTKETVSDGEWNLFSGSKTVSLPDGKNQIWIKAVDKASNIGYSTSSTWYYVDTSAPESLTLTSVDGKTLTGDKLTNGSSAITVKVNVKDFNNAYKDDGSAREGDDPTRVALVNLASIGSNQITNPADVANGKGAPTITDSKKTGEWTVTIPTSALEVLSTGTYQVKLSVQDNAGNEKKYDVFKVDIDKTYPTVTINSPADADKSTTDIDVNNDVILSGTVSDNKDEISEIHLEYYDATASEWKSVTGIDSEATVTKNGNSWSATLDSTKFTDGTSVQLRAVATDAAGNTGNSGTASPYDDSKKISISINQDSDRPVITFSSMKLKTSDTTPVAMAADHQIWLKSQTLYGSVIDDDGITEVKVIAKPSTATEAPSEEEWSAALNIYDNGSWEYNAIEGYSKLYFRVKDSASKTFTSFASTDNTTISNTPKLTDKDTTPNKYGYKVGAGITGTTNVYSTILYIQVDTEDPKIEGDVYYRDEPPVASPANTDWEATFTNPEGNGWKKLSALNSYIGGPNKNLYVYYISKDTNGLNNTVETLGNVTATKVYPSASPTAPYSTDNTECKQVVKFDISRAASSAAVSLAVNVNDRAARSYSYSRTLQIDNEAPEITPRSHNSGVEVYGSSSVQFTGRATDTNEIKKIFYAITKENAKPVQNTFTEITEYISPLSWAIAFDGGTNSNNGLSTIYHDKLLNDLVNDKYNDVNKSGSVDSIPMYIWIYGEDSLGNSGYTTVESTEFIVITQADKPSISISYPLSGDKVGGTVRVSGSASIVDPDKTVSKIWAQIDPDYNPESDTDISSSWETELNALITGKTVGYSIVDGPTGIGKAIEVSGTNNWNLPINVAGEFTKKDNGNNILVNRVVAMKLFAVSSSGKISNPAIVYFTVDPEAPVFGEMTLVQYDTDGNTIIAKRKYESNMWISGQWYLTGLVEDGSGIKSIMKDTSNLPDNEKESAGNNNYYLKIPVGQPAANTNAKGKTEFTLKATENTENNLSSEVRISINYDNKAPDFTFTRTETEITNSSISVKQDNGQYTLRGTVTEAGDESGLARVAFYFTRTKKDGKTYYIDPLTAKGTTGIANQFEVSASPAADGLYWTTINGAKVDVTDVSEIDLGSNSVPAYIRNGGLCKVDKVVYRIKEVSGNKVKVEGKLSVGTNISVDFAYAQVIDNTSSEDGKTSTYAEKTVIYDDGDQMWEQIRQTTTNYQWSASIDSKNIYDGPVTLHFVAYDAAGNSVSSSYSGMVSNNAPKIASVTVGTDFDGDGTISDNEKKIQFTSTESVAHNSKEYSKSVTNKLIVSSDRTTNGKAFMTLKDASVIIPEIVGGNGNLYYSYDIGTTIGAAGNITGNNGTSFATGVDNSIDGYALSSTVTGDGYNHYSTTAREAYVQGQKPGIKLELDDFNNYMMSNKAIGNSDDEDNPTWFCYTIWDETDGLTKFTDSQNATIQVALNVQVHDTDAPSAKIKPFYWTNKDENSLYENSTANGHIELESDLTDDMKAPYKDENKEKPKVSGKITLKGTAYDNVRLSKIYVTFEDHSELKTETLAAEFKKKDGSSEMEWVPATASIDNEGWHFSIPTTSDEAFMNEDGHQVAWQLDIDTQKLSGGAGLDKAIKIRVEDARGEVNENGTIKYGKSSEVGTTQTKTGAETAYYKVDVVPYVTAVGTKFAGKDKSIKGSYSRTSSGKYIVASNETGITLTGFNLTGGKVVFNGTNAETQITNSAFDIPGAARTGAFKVVVNGVDSINNTNNNNAAGGSGKTISDTSSYSDMTNYAYNRCPNNISNNLLTDDLWFDIWELNNKAATSRGALKDPVMHINQGSEDKEIGFGFVNAADGVSFPAAGNSYVWFQKNRKDYKGTNFVYDNNGVAHNISIGLDAQASTGIAGRMNYNNSNWYSDSSKGADGDGDGTIAQWNKRFNIALETIGIPKGIVVKGSKLTANIIDTDRFATPSMAVSTHDNKVPTVYIMYYDFDHDQIRFRYGEINNTDTTNKSRQNGNSTGTKDTDDYNSTATIYNYYQYGLLNDSKCELNSDSDGNGKDSSKNISSTEITSDTAASNNLWSYHHMFEASKDYYALVAGQYYKQTNNDKDAFDTGNKGSAYYGLDVVPGNAIGNDKVVMIWYDEDAQKLMYMYRENLKADGDNTDASSNGVTNIWSKPVALVEDTLLQDCVIKVDSKDGIHIAYYDQTNADLIYGYMSGYDQAANFKTCVVDAYSQVGNRISIDTAVHANGDKVVPYISYFSDGLSSLPKMAYLPNGVSSATDVVDGADADTTLFTGNWEVTLIPTSSVLQPYNVGIGVWKDADNKAIKQQRTKADVAYSTTNYNQKCYANGSSELVVGYSIKANGVGYMETAMRR